MTRFDHSIFILGLATCAGGAVANGFNEWRAGPWPIVALLWCVSAYCSARDAYK